MRSEPAAVRWAVLLGCLVAVLTGLGIPARATYGARVSGDEPYYLLTALSLWEDADLDISDELTEERFRPFHPPDLFPQTRPLENGARISPHDPLLPALLAAPMGVWGWVGAKGLMAVLAGALAAVVAWTAMVRMGIRPAIAVGVAGLFSSAPPLAVYATQVYPEVPAALAVAAAVSALLGALGRSGRWLVLASVVALPWLSVKYVPVAAVLALAAVWRMPPSSRKGSLAWLAGAGLAYAAFHLVVYGGLTPYATGIHFTGGELTVMGSDVDLWGRSTRLLGLLVDRGFGLAAWQPAFLLLPVALGWALRGRSRLVLIWVTATGWLVATFVALTMHGWWFPGRQVVVVLPAAVLAITGWVGDSRGRLAALAVPGAMGVVAFAFLLADGLSGSLTWIVDFGATSNPIYRALGRALPDYMSPTATTWLLHAAWLVATLALFSIGWRGGGDRTRVPTGALSSKEMVTA